MVSTSISTVTSELLIGSLLVSACSQILSDRRDFLRSSAGLHLIEDHELGGIVKLRFRCPSDMSIQKIIKRNDIVHNPTPQLMLVRGQEYQILAVVGSDHYLKVVSGMSEQVRQGSIILFNGADPNFLQGRELNTLFSVFAAIWAQTSDINNQIQQISSEFANYTLKQRIAKKRYSELEASFEEEKKKRIRAEARAQEAEKRAEEEYKRRIEAEELVEKYREELEKTQKRY